MRKILYTPVNPSLLYIRWGIQGCSFHSLVNLIWWCCIPSVKKFSRRKLQLMVGNQVQGDVCVEVLRPIQPNGVMSSMVCLPNHTFTGQAQSSKRLTSIVHILSPETDSCPGDVRTDRIQPSLSAWRSFCFNINNKSEWLTYTVVGVVGSLALEAVCFLGVSSWHVCEDGSLSGTLSSSWTSVRLKYYHDFIILQILQVISTL